MSETDEVYESLERLLEGSSGFRDFLGNLESVGSGPENEGLASPVVNLARFSCALRRYAQKKENSLSEKKSFSGAELNRAVFEGAVAIVRQGGNCDDLNDYLDSFAISYNFLVSLPRLFVAENIPEEKANRFLTVMQCKVSGKKNSVLDDSQLTEEFRDLNVGAMKETDEIVKGISGEIFGYFLLRRLGFNVSHSSRDDDVKRHSDFYLVGNGGLRIPLQVVTGQKKAGFGIFDIYYKEKDRVTYVGINPKKMAEVPELAEEIFVWDIPKSSSGNVIIPKTPSILSQIREQIHEVVSCV